MVSSDSQNRFGNSRQWQSCPRIHALGAEGVCGAGRPESVRDEEAAAGVLRLVGEKPKRPGRKEKDRVHDQVDIYFLQIPVLEEAGSSIL